MDDIVITCATDENHFENLSKVLQRPDDWALRVKRDKCVFMADSVEYRNLSLIKTEDT